MARLVGVDLPRDKRMEVALTYIYGIGRTRSNEILAATGIAGSVDLGAGKNDVLATHHHGAALGAFALAGG